MMKQWYDGYSFRELASVYNRNEIAVAKQIEKIHEEESALYYNNEQALSGNDQRIRRRYSSRRNQLRQKCNGRKKKTLL